MLRLLESFGSYGPPAGVCYLVVWGNDACCTAVYAAVQCTFNEMPTRRAGWGELRGRSAIDLANLAQQLQLNGINKP
jgi:hypothetical protein